MFVIILQASPLCFRLTYRSGFFSSFHSSIHQDYASAIQKARDFIGRSPQPFQNLHNTNTMFQAAEDDTPFHLTTAFLPTTAPLPITTHLAAHSVTAHPATRTHPTRALFCIDKTAESHRRSLSRKFCSLTQRRSSF